MDDVISLGREPERDPRARRGPLSPRWRAAAGMLAVAAAGVAVIGVGSHHGTGSPGTPGSPAASASAAAAAGVPLAPDTPAPAPQSHAPTVICAPSAGTCSMRVRGNPKVLRAEAGA